MTFFAILEDEIIEVVAISYRPPSSWSSSSWGCVGSALGPVEEEGSVRRSLRQRSWAVKPVVCGSCEDVAGIVSTSAKSRFRRGFGGFEDEAGECAQ